MTEANGFTPGEDDFGEWASHAPIEDPLPLDAPIDFQDRQASVSPDEVRVVRWDDLTGADRANMWQRLAKFTDWLIVRYAIPASMIPDCWYRHPGVVEELTALMLAHEVSFDDLDSGLGPIGWHERFALMKLRLQDLYRGECQTGHIDTRTRATTQTDAFAVFVTEDCPQAPGLSTDS